MGRLPAFALLALLAGCAAVGPDYERPEAPKAGAELFVGDGVEVDSLAFWWRGFQDPLLTELVEQGLQSAPSVEAALARLRAARATREGTEAGFWPQFTADGSYAWSRGWGGDGRTKGWDKRLGASADARWEIDVFGGVRRSVERAEAEEARLAYTLQDVRVSLAAEIASAYVAVRRAAALIDIAEENLALQERNAEIAQKRYDAGAVTRYDVATAQAQVARTRASVPALRQDLTAAQLELDWLTGQAPYATQPRMAETQDAMSLPDLSPKTLPNDLLRRRADIRMAEESVHAQTAAVGVATAALYPTFSLGGTIGISSPDLSPWSAYTRSVSFGPSVGWNIFGFGTWRKQVESAKASLEAAVADYRDTVLQAYREAETAWGACLREAERTTALQAAERHSARALAIADTLYTNGEKDIEDMLTQQSNLLSAQENLVTHRAALFDNAITLYRTLGGGWSDEAAARANGDSDAAPDGADGHGDTADGAKPPQAATPERATPLLQAAMRRTPGA